MTVQTHTIGIDELTIDPDIQPRVDGLDAAHVANLQEAPEAWGPLVVARRDKGYVLVDGFHRLAAAQNLGLGEVSVRVIADQDLRSQAFASNAAHGKPLSLADRRAEARRLFGLNPATSNMEIARRVGLSPSTVARIRESIEDGSSPGEGDRRVDRSGRAYTPVQPGRPAGQLPQDSVADAVVETVGRLLTPGQRRAQRKVARYLERLAVALEDGDDLADWCDRPAVAKACRAVLGDEKAVALGEQIAGRAADVAAVGDLLMDPLEAKHRK